MRSATAFIEQLYPSDEELTWLELGSYEDDECLFVLSPGQSILDIINLIDSDNISQVEKLIETGRIYRPSFEQIKRWNMNSSQLFKFLVIKPYIIVQEFNPERH